MSQTSLEQFIFDEFRAAVEGHAYKTQWSKQVIEQANFNVSTNTTISGGPAVLWPLGWETDWANSDTKEIDEGPVELDIMVMVPCGISPRDAKKTLFQLCYEIEAALKTVNTKYQYTTPGIEVDNTEVRGHFIQRLLTVNIDGVQCSTREDFDG